MKTIFRYFGAGSLTAVIFAVGAVAGFGQDPCEDAEGIAALDAKFRTNFNKGIAERKLAVEAGKQFIDKYGACESTKEIVVYFKGALPGMETRIKQQEEKARFDALLTRFDAGLKGKNWNEVYAAGKQILAEKPEEYRDAIVLALGSIGLDETAKTPRVTTWNDETLRYAKMAIADLESGRTFKTFGVGEFKYKDKDDALGWMNYTIGYIHFYDKNNKKEGLGFIYKASQINSDTKTNPIVYQLIGSYYFDDVQKLAKEVDDLVKTQADSDTAEVAKQKVDAIKAKVALVNGTSEAAIDAYTRAYKLAKADPVKFKKEYADLLLKKMQDLYNVRFGKTEGFDSFIATIDKKPLPNPLLPVSPISDPEPVVTPDAAATSTTPVSTTPANGKTGPATNVKPAPTNGTKAAPAANGKPAPVIKPEATVKKTVSKKKVG